MRKYGSIMLFVLLLFINVFWVGFCLSQKQGWHIDEQYTYGHANSTQGTYLSNDIDSYMLDRYTDLHNKKLEGKIFHDYLTTQENERFHYGHIWENLAKSVHPPLFYVLVHTVCSFMPDKFSPWQVGGLNLIFFMLTLVVFYKLSKLFIKNEYLAMIPVFVWGFSEAGLSTALFLRMYMLQTLLAVCLLYEVSKALIENKADKKQLFLIFLYAALGNLTQFSSLILAFFTAAVAGVVLLYRKNFKLLSLFFLMMLLSVVALFAIYPQAYEVLFHSHRGGEVTQKMDNVFSDLLGFGRVLLYNNTDIFEAYFQRIFGFESFSDIVLLGCFLLVMTVFYFSKKHQNKVFYFLFFIWVLMTLYIAFCMSSLKMFSWRYYMLVMPIATLVILVAVFDLCSIFFKNKKFITFFSVVLCLVWAVTLRPQPFLFRMEISPQTKTLQEKVKDKHIVLVAPTYLFLDLAYLFSQTDGIYWCFSDDVLSFLDKADYLFVANKKIRRSEKIERKYGDNYPNYKREFISDKIADKVKYVALFRSGLGFYDVYEVIKK